MFKRGYLWEDVGEGSQSDIMRLFAHTNTNIQNLLNSRIYTGINPQMRGLHIKPWVCSNTLIIVNNYEKRKLTEESGRIPFLVLNVQMIRTDIRDYAIHKNPIFFICCQLLCLNIENFMAEKNHIRHKS